LALAMSSAEVKAAARAAKAELAARKAAQAVTNVPAPVHAPMGEMAARKAAKASTKVRTLPAAPQYPAPTDSARMHEHLSMGASWSNPEGPPPPRHNQHPATSLKGVYLGLLLRALTGGLQSPGMPEPVTGGKPRKNDGGLLGQPSVVRVNSGCSAADPSCLLTWDGYQRAMETGRVLERVLDAGVEGAIAEVGVYKGGMAAYLQGILLARHLSSMGSEPLRELWLIDSFRGMPSSDRMRSENAGRSRDPATGLDANSATDRQARWSGTLAISRRTVWRNLERVKLLDQPTENVRFLEGFVNDTLPSWPHHRSLALLRVDVDIYAATYDALHYLYPRLRRGGAVLFDDYKLPFSSAAINDYRRSHGITTAIKFLPGCVDPMAFWIKE